VISGVGAQYCPYRTGAVAVVLALVLLALTAGQTLAHTELVAADPAFGAQLIEPPELIRLTFSEPLQPGSTFALYGEEFALVEGLVVHINPEVTTELMATAPPLEPGLYTVQWTAVGNDGHAATGSYNFTVLAFTQEQEVLSGAEMLAIALVAVGALALGLSPLMRRNRE
jgi:methionine-rich copper-binding protein CopC